MNAVTKKTVTLKDTGETIDGVTVLGAQALAPCSSPMASSSVSWSKWR